MGNQASTPTSRQNSMKRLLEDIQKKRREGTPLMFAVLFDDLRRVTEIIAKNRGSMNEKDSDGNTPLHYAVILPERFEIFQFLLDQGANFSVSNNRGFSVIDVAALAGTPEMIESLHAKATNFDAPDEDGSTSLILAADGKNSAVVEKLCQLECKVDAANKKSMTALHVAAHNGDTATVQILLKHAANTVMTNVDGHTAFELVAKGNIETINAFMPYISKDAVFGKNKDTALHLLAEKGLTQQISVLVDRGFDVNAVNAKNETPIYSAIRKDQTDTVKMLLRLKASVSVVDNAHRTPVDAGINGYCADELQTILLLASDIGAVFGENRDSALHLAAAHDLAEAAGILIQRGHDINAINEKGDTPLHIGLKRYNASASEVHSPLMKNNARTDIPNKAGKTAAQIVEDRKPKEKPEERIAEFYEADDEKSDGNVQPDGKTWKQRLSFCSSWGARGKKNAHDSLFAESPKNSR